jgi:hypothetical protein
VAGRWFSLGTPVFTINETVPHDLTEILLTVALNTTTLTLALHVVTSQLPCFSGVRVAQSLIFRVVFCRSLFVLFLSVIVLSVLLRIMGSYYPLVSSNVSCVKRPPYGAVRSNPAHVEVYSIQQYLIKFLSYLWQVGGFLWVLQCSPLMKLSPMIYY